MEHYLKMSSCTITTILHTIHNYITICYLLLYIYILFLYIYYYKYNIYTIHTYTICIYSIHIVYILYILYIYTIIYICTITLFEDIVFQDNMSVPKLGVSAITCVENNFS